LAEEELREQRDATLNSFSRNVVGNSRADASENSESGLPAQVEPTAVMTGEMNAVDDGPPAPSPMAEFKPWENTWTWAQALEADRMEKEERQSFNLEFGWMTEADHCLLGHGPRPIELGQFFSNSQANG
jgi:hypothetical protein